MIITIELAPEEEARRRAKAAREGQDVDSYLKSVILQTATQGAEPEASAITFSKTALGSDRERGENACQ